MKRCCVIGGNGFIGQHLIDLLVESGRKVDVVDTVAPLQSRHKVGVTCWQYNRGDKKFLQSILKKCDEAVDLAYSTVPKTSFEDPIQDIKLNLPFGVELFHLAAKTSIRKLIIVSSGGTVYGEPLKIPICEDHPTNPISPYGITKLAIEKYALMFFHLHSLPVIILRPGNAFGEHQRPFASQGFIATAMASIVQGKKITLFGRMGTIRDYIYVKDIDSGVVSALEKGKEGSIYNLGSGIGRTNKDVLQTIKPLARVRDLAVRAVIAPHRKFDVSTNILDSTKLRVETGWQIKISFEDGIKKTWDWFVKHHAS